jgi:hypothetical protein
MIELHPEDVNEVAGGINWAAVGIGLGAASLAITVAATGGLAMIPVGIILGAGTGTELALAGVALGLATGSGLAVGTGMQN